MRKALKSNKLITVVAPFAMSAGLFIGAELYTPRTDEPHISIEREAQEPYVVDLLLAGLDLFAGLFALQAVNHATMLYSRQRSRDIDLIDVAQ